MREQFLPRAVLEHELRRKLDDAYRGVKPEERAVGACRRAGHARDHAERRVAQSGVRQAEVRMVEDVEGLDSDTQIHPLAQREVAIEIHIRVEEVRATKLVAVLR